MCERKRCSGIVRHQHTKQCDRYVDEKIEYCKHHTYFNNLSDEQIDKIKNGEGICCNRCGTWRLELVGCQVCNDYNNEFKRIKNANKKCGWKDRHMDPCKRLLVDDTLYCDIHQYVKDYTDEMKELSELCKGCNKVKYLVDGCDHCKERAKGYREKDKLIEKPRCKGFVGENSCSFEADDDGYCGKHKLQAWKIDIEKDGSKKVCSNYIRGCRNLMDMSCEFINCEGCRKNDRQNENSYKTYLKSAEKRQINFELSEYEINELIKQNCYYCGDMNDKGFNGIDRINNDKIIGYKLNNVLPCCSICNFMKQKTNDSAAFIDYCINISKNYNKSEYYKPQTDTYIKKKINKTKYKCKQNNRNFNLSFGESKVLLEMTCYYCNNTNSDKIGIDRFEQDSGYELNNCKSCCKICNFIKWTFSPYIILDKVCKIYKLHYIDKKLSF